MKKIIFGLVTVLLTGLTMQEAKAQDPSVIGKGASLWANNCTRCHNARSPMERNDRGWLTVVQHMRARANLTKTEARAITAYLQAINTPEAGVAMGFRDGQNRTAGTKALHASESVERQRGKSAS